MTRDTPPAPRIAGKPRPRPGQSAGEEGRRMAMPNVLVIGAAKPGTTALKRPSGDSRASLGCPLAIRYAVMSIRRYQAVNPFQ
ncbi:hypothetical protein [Nitrolancea hollandica]|nr:hypothetical protein [Nitrolancea hollandica]